MKRILSLVFKALWQQHHGKHNLNETITGPLKLDCPSCNNKREMGCSSNLYDPHVTTKVRKFHLYLYSLNLNVKGPHACVSMIRVFSPSIFGSIPLNSPPRPPPSHLLLGCPSLDKSYKSMAIGLHQWYIRTDQTEETNLPLTDFLCF